MGDPHKSLENIVKGLFIISLKGCGCSGSKRVLHSASISGQMLPNATSETYYTMISSCLAPSALKPGLNFKSLFYDFINMAYEFLVQLRP